MKTAIKTTLADKAAEEPLSKNLMIFGLKEKKDENLMERVEKVFQDLGKRPKFVATQVGRSKSGVVN